MSIVRKNLMTQAGYAPYCGNVECRIMPRAIFSGRQFECPCCGWVSGFDKAFIDEYKKKWGK